MHERKARVGEGREPGHLHNWKTLYCDEARNAQRERGRELLKSDCGRPIVTIGRIFRAVVVIEVAAEVPVLAFGCNYPQ